MISVFPDVEGFELSVILPVQDMLIAVPHDHGDQVMGNVEGQSPEEQVVQKSDYDRVVDLMNEQFLQERNKKREEADQENARLRRAIREEQDQAFDQMQQATRNACVQRINEASHKIRRDTEDQIASMASNIKEDALDLVRFERDRAEEQMNVLRLSNRWKL